MTLAKMPTTCRVWWRSATRVDLVEESDLHRRDLHRRDLHRYEIPGGVVRSGSRIIRSRGTSRGRIE
jgi:hypothetical protein